MADLEKELEETLGDFDEEIEREQGYAEGRANEDGIDDSDDPFAGEGAFDDYDESEDGVAKGQRQPSSSGGESSEGQSAEGSQSQDTGGESSDVGEKREGEAQEQQAENDIKKDDRPDVEDLRKNDDIVARQIRESAENETDPELKKKLWDEYYKYKNQ